MSVKIHSTAERATDDLAKAGVLGSRPVMMVVLDADEEARLTELRALIADGEASGEVDEETAFGDIHRHLAAGG